MTSKVFTDYITPIDAAWLNDVNTVVNTTLPAETAARIAADNLLAPLASPALTGVPTAPTAAPGTNTTQVATTAYATALAAVTLASATTASVPRTSTTGAAVLPTGTTAQRDVAPAVGYTRFNTIIGKTEVWNGTAWSKNFTEIVSVKDYGAVGDGVSNDTTAINAAFSASNGRTILFPSGNYLVTSTIGLDVLATGTEIKFEGGTILAGANNLIVFQSTVHAWGVKFIDPHIEGNGFTGVVAFDVIRLEQLGAGIFRPVLRNMATGIFLRSLCTGCNIDDPDIVNVTSPIIILDAAGGVRINHPRINTFGTNGIDIRPITTYGDVGVQIIGGYIQHGGIGILDAGYNTQVIGTYFETCTVADISLVSGSRYFMAEATNHTASGVVAFLGRNADSAYIRHPFMASGGRSTGLFDFDSSNTNCVYDVIFGASSMNTPVGDRTGIQLYVPKFSAGTFTPTLIGSTTAGTCTYVTQDGKWERIGDRVFVNITVGWNSHTGTGVMQVVGIPSLNPISKALYGIIVSPGFAFTGPVLYSYPPAIGGANTTYNIAQVSTAGTLSFVPFAAAGSAVLHIEYLTTSI